MYTDGGAVLEKPDVAKLESMFNKTPHLQFGGGNGNGGDIGRGGGGGDDGDGSGDSFEYNKNRLTADEKYGLKGMFAKECLLFNLPKEYTDDLKSNPLKEMADIQKIRTILESLFFTTTFPAAFDLKTKKIHFYTRFDDAQLFAKDNKAFITLGDIQNTTNQSNFDYDENIKKGIQPETILLNSNFHYLRKNMMIDCDKDCLSDKTSFTLQKLGNKETSGLYQFIPNQLVYHYVSRLMKEHDEFKVLIEEYEKEYDEAKQESNDISNNFKKV